MERMEFTVGGDTLRGDLHLPEGAPKGAVVVTGPLTSVKEQVPTAYAEALSRRGYAVLAFDHRHFGASDGEPRSYEDPGRKIEDVRAAIGALRDRFGALPIHALGVCAGGGYMAGAVAEDDRPSTFAAVAGFFHDGAKTREWMGDGYGEAMDRAVAARESYEVTGEAEYIPAVGEGDVAMPLPEAAEYYGTERGQRPGYENRFAVMSREKTLPYDAQGAAGRIAVPFLMVHSENALSPALARDFYDKVPGSKIELWLESKGQIDFYDDPVMIEPAAEAIDRHFSAA